MSYEEDQARDWAAKVGLSGLVAAANDRDKVYALALEAFADGMAARKAKDASLTLRICTAYESGFGQAGRALDNPYKLSTPEAEAWNIGYQEGAKRKSAAQSGNDFEKFCRALDAYRAALHDADVAPCAPGIATSVRRQERIDTARVAVIELAFPPQPIPMILHCPRCHAKHVDAPQPDKNWTNPPHRSHECQHCQFIWRPSDAYTIGVDKIETRGQRDSRPQRCAGTLSSDPPQDCDWPFCGCDHHATKVLQALQESGWSRGDAEDAAKWRALRNCARITAVGCEGLGVPTALARPEARLTLDFWTHNEREKEAYPRRWLDQFVEKALRLTKGNS